MSMGLPLTNFMKIIAYSSPEEILNFFIVGTDIKNAKVQSSQFNPLVKSFNLGKLVFFLQVYDKNDEI